MVALMHRSRSLFRRAWPLAGLLAVLLPASCGRKAPEAAAAPEWLARVNGDTITAADIQFEIQRRTEAGRPVGDAAAILQELIQRKVMLQEAGKSELLNDPAVRREMENRQLGQWLDRSLQVERDRVRVSDEELKAHYDAHRDSFARPEMTRLAILYRRASTRDPQEADASVREELEKGRAAFLADPAAATQQGRIPGFGTVAASYSEDAVSRYRGGDLGWLETNEESPRHPAAVLEAGRALAIGGISDVIAAGDGLYVVMKIDQRASQVSSFDEVAPALRRRLIRLKQEEVERTFVSNLLAGAKVEVDREKAARLKVAAAGADSKTAAVPPSGWSPGSESLAKPDSPP